MLFVVVGCSLSLCVVDCCLLFLLFVRRCRCSLCVVICWFLCCCGCCLLFVGRLLVVCCLFVVVCCLFVVVRSWVSLLLCVACSVLFASWLRFVGVLGDCCSL